MIRLNSSYMQKKLEYALACSARDPKIEKKNGKNGRSSSTRFSKRG